MRGRQGTAARMQTGAREVNYTGVGYNSKINAIDRPVTNHGMMGMNTKTVGPGRQIYDRNYYANQMKQKNIEIASEIQKMKQEVEDINKDNQTYITLERKYESLIKDVRKYEGELADYNLALDKHRSDTKPEDIEALYMHIKNQNDKQRVHLDSLFSEKRDMENEIHSYEQQIQEINYANESKLNDLDPEQRNEYEKLKNDNNQLLNQINNSRNELEEVNVRLAQAENRLKADTLKQRAQHLRDEKHHLQKRKEDLELQTNEMHLPFPEARERLMNRIKEDNAQIKQQEKEVSDMRKMIETYQKNIKEITSEIAGGPKAAQNEDSQKYEILYQKEKEINEFTIKYEEEKAQYERDIADNQKIILALLEHMAKNMTRQNRLPSHDQVDEMRKDLNFKQRQLNDAEMTAAKLQVEVEARTSDLEKIRTLEERIEKEMQSVAEGINNMENDLANKFTKIDQLTAGFEEEKNRLFLIKKLVSQYKSHLSKQTTYHAVRHDTSKNQILQSDIYNKLNEIEKRLIGNES